MICVDCYVKGISIPIIENTLKLKMFYSPTKTTHYPLHSLLTRIILSFYIFLGINKGKNFY